MCFIFRKFFLLVCIDFLLILSGKSVSLYLYNVLLSVCLYICLLSVSLLIFLQYLFYTDKKENQLFLRYKEIHELISCKVIYDQRPPHIWLNSSAFPQKYQEALPHI
jgi:hypothetical protein